MNDWCIYCLFASFMTDRFRIIIVTIKESLKAPSALQAHEGGGGGAAG